MDSQGFFSNIGTVYGKLSVLPHPPTPYYSSFAVPSTREKKTGNICRIMACECFINIPTFKIGLRDDLPAIWRCLPPPPFFGSHLRTPPSVASSAQKCACQNFLMTRVQISFRCRSVVHMCFQIFF